MRRLLFPQLPHSLDLAPVDYFLFPKWKSSIKGRRFQTVEAIEENSIRDFAPSAKHVPGRVPEIEGGEVGRFVSRVEGSTLKVTSLVKL